MNSTGALPDNDNKAKIGRPRDSVASKDALLQAAQVMFGQKGFEQTTIREIGERAGVDAALIARYFGNKADLYIASVVAEDQNQQPPRDYQGLPQMADAVLTRSDERGPGPILQALVRSDTSSEIRRAAQDRVARRLVDPLVADMTEHQVDRPRLRAEIAIAALFGVSLGRSLGWFEELRSVPRQELIVLLATALEEVTKEATDSPVCSPAPDASSLPTTTPGQLGD